MFHCQSSWVKISRLRMIFTTMTEKSHCRLQYLQLMSRSNSDFQKVQIQTFWSSTQFPLCLTFVFFFLYTFRLFRLASMMTQSTMMSYSTSSFSIVLCFFFFFFIFLSLSLTVFRIHTLTNVFLIRVTKTTNKSTQTIRWFSYRKYLKPELERMASTESEFQNLLRSTWNILRTNSPQQFFLSL